MLRRLIIITAALAALLILPGMAAAQAPSQAPEQAPAAPAAPPAAPQAGLAPAQTQAQPQCQMGPGGTCPMMTPEQMKQMQGKMGQCCLQPGQGCPMRQQMQKQLDDLRQRLEALEGKKGKKK